MSQKVFLLKPAFVLDVIYNTVMINFKPVPKAFLRIAVQQAAAFHKAQFNPRQFEFIFNTLVFRNMIVDVGDGFFKAAHAS